MTSRDSEIAEILGRLAELAGDPTDLELRAALTRVGQRKEDIGRIANINECVRLVARIDDIGRRDEWAVRFAREADHHVTWFRTAVVRYR